jgi:hypothetical protein
MREKLLSEKSSILARIEEEKFEPSLGFGIRTMRFNPQFSRYHTQLAVPTERVCDLCRIADIECTVKRIEALLEKTYNIVTEALVVNDSLGAASIEIQENVLDVGGETTDRKSAGFSDAPMVGQQEILSITNFLKRPIQIDSFEIKVGDGLSAAYSVWDIITSDASVRAKLKNFAYLRCNVKVRIAVSGTPFHAGKLLVSYQPYPQRNETLKKHIINHSFAPTYRPLLLNYLSQAPGATVMDVKDNRPLEMLCPFISTKSMHRLFNVQATAISAVTPFNDMYQAGSLFIYSLNDITAVTAEPTSISVHIYAWLDDVQLGTTSATHMEIVTEGRDERRRGPVERVSSALATVTDALSAVPAIGQLARASSMVLRGVSGVASWFGWSRPQIVSEPNFVKNRPFANSCITIGSETVEKLSFDPLQELTVDPRVTGVDFDELTIPYLSSIESYLTTFTWDTGGTLLGDPIWISRVLPTLSTVHTSAEHNFYQPTPMCFVAQAFQYWRGHIKFRFEVVCSAFHRGKLAFYYEPNIYQCAIINADLATNKNFLKIIDIQETQSVEFCVNWAQPRAWNFVQDSTDVHTDNYTTNGSFTLIPPGYSNGYIGVVPFTDLQAPMDVPVSVNVYVSGDNLQFNFLTDRNFPVERRIITEADIHYNMDDTEVTCLELNDSSSVPTATSEYYFGEQPLSFRAALKRYVTTAEDAATCSITARSMIYAARTIVPAYPPYSDTVTADRPTLMQALPYAFLGVRGGVRKRVRFFIPSDITNGEFCYAVATNGDPFDTIATGLSFVNAPSYSNQRGSVIYVPHTNAGIEFEVPYYSNNLFEFSCADDFIGTNADDDMVEEWIQLYTCTADAHLSNGNVIRAVECTAAAEDFSFLRFLGAPYFTTPLA